MAYCLIGLGANLGDRGRALDAAVERLACAEVRVVAKSRYRQTEPVGGPPGQTPYLNGAVLVETALTPRALLRRMQSIELELGRRRDEEVRWGARPIDLDLLLYDTLMLFSEGLTVPHPRMAWRRFVLEPAAEIAGAMRHPTTNWTVARLWNHLNSTLNYVAVSGPAGAGAVRLVAALARGNPRIVPLVEPPLPKRLLETAADPAGQGAAAALEWVCRLRARLDPRADPWADRRLQPTAGGNRAYAVSDFWLDEPLAFAESCLRRGPLARFRRVWESAAAVAVAPRLLVVLAPPEHEETAEEICARARRRVLCSQAWCLRYLEQMENRYQSPIGPSMHFVTPPLRAGSASLCAVAAEVLDAIASMG